MKLLIEKSDLELLLEKKRDLIGNKVTIDTIIAGISFLLSVFIFPPDDLRSLFMICFRQTGILTIMNYS